MPFTSASRLMKTPGMMLTPLHRSPLVHGRDLCGRAHVDDDSRQRIQRFAAMVWPAGQPPVWRVRRCSPLTPVGSSLVSFQRFHAQNMRSARVTVSVICGTTLENDGAFDVFPRHLVKVQDSDSSSAYWSASRLFVRGDAGTESQRPVFVSSAQNDVGVADVHCQYHTQPFRFAIINIDATVRAGFCQ